MTENSDLREYLERVLVGRKDRDKVIADIISRIEKACKITSLSKDDLLLGLDFDSKNLTIGYLESFLAELRGIFWLDNLGFTDIIPLPKSKKHASSDISAFRGGDKYAIEVFCLTRSCEQKRDTELGVYIDFNSKFLIDLLNKKSKKRQLDAMASIKRKILLCVLNASPQLYLNTRDDFLSILKEVSCELNWGEGYFLGMLTGNSSEEDMIYPKLC